LTLNYSALWNNGLIVLNSGDLSGRMMRVSVRLRPTAPKLVHDALLDAMLPRGAANYLPWIVWTGGNA